MRISMDVSTSMNSPSCTKEAFLTKLDSNPGISSILSSSLCMISVAEVKSLLRILSNLSMSEIPQSWKNTSNKFSVTEKKLRMAKKEKSILNNISGKWERLIFKEEKDWKKKEKLSQSQNLKNKIIDQYQSLDLLLTLFFSFGGGW